MMIPTVIVREASRDSTSLQAANVDDLAHVRRLLLQAVFSVEGEENTVKEHEVPLAKLHLLRGFLDSAGCKDKGSIRRVLLMALLQLEDDDDTARFVKPVSLLPIVTGNR